MTDELDLEEPRTGRSVNLDRRKALGMLAGLAVLAVSGPADAAAMRKARKDRLAPSSSTTTTTTAPTSPPLAPAEGATSTSMAMANPLIGFQPSGPYGSTTSVTDVQSVIGADYQLHGLFFRLNEAFPASVLHSHRTVTRAQFYLTLEPWAVGNQGPDHPAYSCANVAAGQHDADLIRWADGFKSFPEEVFIVRTMHEMNNTPYPWSVGFNGNNEAHYVTAWRHMVRVFASQGVTNVRWFWCPSDSGAPTVPMVQVYPGDDVVDFVGLDGYNWGTSQWWSAWKNPDQLFDAKLRELALFAPQSKPRIIGETSSVEGFGGSKADWIRRLRPWARNQDLYGFCWFDFDYRSHGEFDWRLNTSTAARDAARQAWFGA